MDATDIGFINSTDILIAKNADPHIALNNINKKILFENNFLFRKIIFYFLV
tara:strand:+ start:306 stop:458 length:153 start_codon:yes stop_codon:yes gene_type:complete